MRGCYYFHCSKELRNLLIDFKEKINILSYLLGEIPSDAGDDHFQINRPETGFQIAFFRLGGDWVNLSPTYMGRWRTSGAVLSFPYPGSRTTLALYTATPVDISQSQ
jgi:hypothetical protein